MRLSFQLVALLVLFGCNSGRPLITKSIINDDAILINQMTEAIDKRPDYFLSNLKNDTLRLAHDIDSLGFNYTIESGAYKLNERVYFWMKIIKKNDTLISFSADPFYWTIGGRWESVYNNIYKSAGWNKDKNRFIKKYFNYSATLLPLETLSLNQSKNLNEINMLMTPFGDHVYRTGSSDYSILDYKKFEKIASKFDDDELYYLLNSINPATRAYTAKYIKCNRKQFSERIKIMIEKLLKESTKFANTYGSIMFYDDLSELIKCE